MTASSPENPHAGQGAVLLDIGGEVGALVVAMPAGMEGDEVEIRPRADVRHDPDHSHDPLGHHHQGQHHEHDPSGAHHPHVAVVNRPVHGTHLPSLVFPELVEGGYELYAKGTDDVRLTVDVRGGEVTTAAWPDECARP